MASLRRGLVDKVKKAAKSVGKRGAQVAAKVGTRGARALVETTAAAVKTVDKVQSKLGRAPRKATLSEEPMRAAPRAAPKTAQEKVGDTAAPRAKRASAPRESGRKDMPTQAVAAKSAKAPAPKKEFKAKRGQKHLHTGR
jgi:hypothetical protein